ncbi:multicopper oxidase family protein [Pontibacillus litoralis]|uniref:Copper-containing nitrite reductase n=1 Tax=Pontibacillus litoralis JSM 072002 TaxID=1385512 RepID=A0A0A5G7G8_9BACI|nr:multicopper oxidase family protein [Pontibacillus litoralis]KGX87020.1 copper oxidase [Pontibacillus litoralis JSM 072002]
MKKHIIIGAIVMVSLLSACAQSDDEAVDKKEQELIEVKQVNAEGRNVKEVEITAEEAEWELDKENKLTAYTYNGAVPGEQIRVQEGDVLRVNFTNFLDESATIHWHGIPVPNSEDGIPGVTQDAVQSGESYTYEFVAEDPGTYWYHTHQNGAEMIDKGLYGSIIVEPKEGIDADKDYTLVLDEWESSKLNDHNQETESSEGHGSMMHDMSSYDVYTINGKTYDGSKPLTVEKGEKVKLRFINAGYVVHHMHIPVQYKVTHVDGQKVNQPNEQDGLLEIAPGERYDIEFVANGDKNFTIDRHGKTEATPDMRIDVVYEEGNGAFMEHKDVANQVDITRLGNDGDAPFTLNDIYDVEYTMDLGTTMDHSEMAMKWTINDKVYPETPPLKVSKGDKVKVQLKNSSMDHSTHPMHLHGHFFQVLSKNGEHLSGSPIIKDTLNVKPGETYEVAFVANNPGNWLFHCHDLHHASNGMVTEVKYNNFKPFYKDSGKVDNQPE